MGSPGTTVGQRRGKTWTGRPSVAGSKKKKKLVRYFRLGGIKKEKKRKFRYKKTLRYFVVIFVGCCPEHHQHSLLLFILENLNKLCSKSLVDTLLCARFNVTCVSFFCRHLSNNRDEIKVSVHRWCLCRPAAILPVSAALKEISASQVAAWWWVFFKAAWDLGISAQTNQFIRKWKTKEKRLQTPLLCNIKATKAPEGFGGRGTRKLEAEGQMEIPSASFATEHLWLRLSNEANKDRYSKSSDSYSLHLSGLERLAYYSPIRRA